MNVGDTATLLPATALANRNAIKITNHSGTDKLYLGPSSVTADNVIGTTSGDEVGTNESINFDITDAIPIYGRAETGKTIRVKIVELA